MGRLLVRLIALAQRRPWRFLEVRRNVYAALYELPEQDREPLDSVVACTEILVDRMFAKPKRFYKLLLPVDVRQFSLEQAQSIFTLLLVYYAYLHAVRRPTELPRIQSNLLVIVPNQAKAVEVTAVVKRILFEETPNDEPRNRFERASFYVMSEITLVIGLPDNRPMIRWLPFYEDSMRWLMNSFKGQDDQIRVAAAQGDATAQNDLGLMYAAGRGVVQDAEEAVRWFRLAAAQGDARAQTNLGWIYDTGQGVVQDAEEAVRWYRLAAAQGDATAQTLLGGMYAAGRGVAQYAEEAVRWIRLAAAQGDATAQALLRGMYAAGRGVAQDDLPS